jgi:hypothetical protein
MPGAAHLQALRAAEAQVQVMRRAGHAEPDRLQQRAVQLDPRPSGPQLAQNLGLHAAVHGAERAAGPGLPGNRGVRAEVHRRAGALQEVGQQFGRGVLAGERETGDRGLAHRPVALERGRVAAGRRRLGVGVLARRAEHREPPGHGEPGPGRARRGPG